MSLRVEYSTEADFGDISADGEIDLATVSRLRSAITKALQAGAQHVTLNLDRVTYIDSSGLGTLVGTHKRLASSGGTFTVRCSQARVLRLFSITGIDKVLTVTRGDEALASAGLSEAAPA